MNENKNEANLLVSCTCCRALLGSFFPELSFPTATVVITFITSKYCWLSSSLALRPEFIALIYFIRFLIDNQLIIDSLFVSSLSRSHALHFFPFGWLNPNPTSFQRHLRIFDENCFGANLVISLSLLTQHLHFVFRFLVACYATLHPALSVRRSGRRTVTLHFFFWFLRSLASLLLPKWSSDLKYGPCPPARDWG